MAGHLGQQQEVFFPPWEAEFAEKSSVLLLRRPRQEDQRSSSQACGMAVLMGVILSPGGTGLCVWGTLVVVTVAFLVCSRWQLEILSTPCSALVVELVSAQMYHKLPVS